MQSLLNLEPVNWQIRQEQPDFYLPSFNLGSELANGTCSLVGLDFETWYSLLSCPRMLIEVAVSLSTCTRVVTKVVMKHGVEI